jgi:hypothetical protein
MALQSPPDLVAQFIHLQLDPHHTLHLNGEFSVNILDLPVHGRDESLPTLAAGTGLGTSRALGAPDASMSGGTNRTCFTRQASAAVRPRYPRRPGRTGDSAFTTRPLFQLRHLVSLLNEH